jgi:hypothetical protein
MGPIFLGFRLTKGPKEPKSILDFRREETRPKSRSTRNPVLNLVGSAGLALGAVFAAGSIIIPQIELGAGVASLPECIRGTTVDFDLQVFTTGTTIRALDVRGIGPGCNGQYLQISLVGANNDVIRQLPSNRLSTNSSLRIVVPAPALDPATVFGMNLDLSDSPF